MNRPLVVWTTTATREEALQLAERLVNSRLAACTQVEGPLQTIYRWKGRVESVEEWRCVIKTVEERYAALETAIREFHSYDVPQIIALPVTHGLSAYLEWLEENTTGTSAQEGDG